MKMQSFSAKVRRQVGLASAIAGLVMVAACGAGSGGNSGGGASAEGEATVLDQAEWDRVVEDAKAEGTLVVYASVAGVETTIDAFKAEYPEIDVQVVRESSADLISRLGLELQSGTPSADVAFIGAPEWYDQQVEAGTLAPLQLGPEADELGWTDLDTTRAGYASIMRNPLVIGINTDLGQEVSSIEELIEVAGETNAPVGVFEPTVPAVIYQYQRWEEEYGDDIVDELAELNVTRYRSGVPMAQSLAAGEIAYAIPLGTGNIPPLAAEGAPVTEVVPETGVGIEYRAGTLNNAPHPNAAQLFVNWLMTERAQTLLVQNQGPAATPIPIEGALGWGDLPLYDPEEMTVDVQEQYAQEFGEKFSN